jgi:hypothetical protein
MLTLGPELNNIIQALIVVILIGMLYSLWKTTRAYGGLIGRAIQLIGVGIILISIVVMEKMLVNFSVITNSENFLLGVDVLTLVSLFFLSLGFKRLASIAKAP